MEIRAYIQPLIKWWRLILIATILAGVSSFWVTLGQPLNYQSRTTLLVGSALSNPNPDSGQIYLASQLATIYAQFARSQTIQMATKETLGITWLPQYNVRVIPNSQLIEITVIDVIPERAQIIASEIANQLILLSPVNASSGTGNNRQEFINEQLDVLQTQIVSTREEILRLQQELGNLNSAREIENVKNQISALESKLSTLQLNYSGLLSSTSEGAVNTIQVVEPATLPTTPIGPNKLLIVMVTALIGAVIAGAAAYLLDYLNKTLDTIEDIKREFPFPILGEIPLLSKKESIKCFTFIDQNPVSGFAEAFRKLRTNIEISSREKPVRTILITSSSEGDGKSTVAMNLAIAFSYLGKKVILLDADFRHHRVHEALDLQQEPGLNELLSGENKLEEVIQHWKGNIFAISSGRFMPNASELISSQQFLTTLSELRGIADLIVIDAPPFFLSETSSMSIRVDGILVVTAIGNSKEMVRRMKSQLEIIRAPLLGVIVNRVGEKGYYGYYYNRYSEVPTKPIDREKVPVSKGVFSPVFDQVGVLLNKVFQPKGFRKTSAPRSNEDEVVKKLTPSLDDRGHSSEAASLDVKTVPRITNPKSILDRVILKSSRKAVEEDIEYLQEIARRKREQSMKTPEKPETGDGQIDLTFLESLQEEKTLSSIEDEDDPGSQAGDPKHPRRLNENTKTPQADIKDELENPVDSQ